MVLTKSLRIYFILHFVTMISAQTTNTSVSTQMIATTTVGLMTTVTPPSTSSQTAGFDNSTVIYTIGGNAGGDQCVFPMVFMGVTYTSCTTAGRSDGFNWCATTNNYAVDYTWGFCPQPVSGCGDFWDDEPFGKYCYQFNFQSSLTWVQARDACRQQNADLLSIISTKEQGWIAGRIQIVTTVMWLGLSDVTVEGNWAWSDQAPLTYLNWREGQPNSYGGNEDCGAIITRNGLWGDTPCSRKLSFICKKVDETAVTPSPPPNFSNASDVDMLCYHGDGTYYKGSINTTHSNKSCAKWSTKTPSFDLKGNACRNPDHSPLPWCYTNDPKAPWEYCDIPKCNVQTYCKRGWKQVGKLCYRLGCTIPSTWPSGQDQCKKDGANLARINNGDDMNEIFAWMKQIQPWTGLSEIWIGLNDRDHEMMFTWIPKLVVNFTYWDKDQPNDVRGTDNCVKMDITTGRWNDIPCTLKLQFLCAQEPTEAIMPDVSMSDGICQGRQSGGKTGNPGSNKTSIQYPTAPTLSGCPDGWVGFGIYCFKLDHDVANWTIAYRLCKNRYGNDTELLLPHDRYEQAFLSSQLARYNADVNFHLNVLSVKHIADGILYNNWYFFEADLDNITRTTTIKYTNWAMRQPTAVDVQFGMCGYISAGHLGGLWSVGDCSDKRRVACMKMRDGITPFPPPAPTSAQAACPDGWTGIGTKCYRVYIKHYRRIRKTWSEAREFCMKQGGQDNVGGGDLASMHSVEQQRQIHKLLPYWVPGTLWIGLNDRNGENKFVWSDGSTLTYINWAKDEPNNLNGNEDCVEYNSRLSDPAWNDGNCNKLANWICEINRGAVIPDLANVTTPAPVTCGDDSWLYNNGNCYFFSERERITYYEARDKCMSKGGDLASIHSKDELNFIHLVMQRKSSIDWWIGLDSNNGDRQFRWLDGTGLNFIMWREKEPNDANRQEQCVEMYQDSGKWNDQNCGRKYGYVCKRRNGTSTTAVTPTPEYRPRGFCPGDWWNYRGNCIKVFGLEEGDKLNWTDARDECMALGGKLLSIPNAQQQAYVTSHLFGINATDIWIGLNDIHGEGTFLWRDGTPFKFQNWKHGEPNSPGYRASSANQDCTKITTSKWNVGRWADDLCDNEYAYICEKHMSENTKALCADHPKSNWKTMCQDVIKSGNDCQKLKRRQKEMCMLTCKMCDRFIRPQRVPNATPRCKKGFRFWNDECWTLTKSNMTWDEGVKYCADHGAVIATVTDEYTQAWAFSQLADPSENPELSLPVGVKAWMGLRKYDGSQKYSWQNKWPVTLTKWGNGQPSAGNSSTPGCVAMDARTEQGRQWQGGFWLDTDCNANLPVLCRITDRKPPKNINVYPGKCPDTSWIAYKENCYLLRTEIMSTWYQAEYDCLRVKSHSASINDEEEANFIVRQTANSRVSSYLRRNVWIGLYRSLDDDSYSWTDNSPLSYLNWAENEPSKSGGIFKEVCTELSVSDGKWRDTTCNKIGITVCKSPKILDEPDSSGTSGTAVPSKAASSHVVVAIIVVLVVLAVCGLVFVYYYRRNRSGKDSYGLHLPSVSFRDFISSAPGFRSFMSSSSADQQGLVEEMGDEEGDSVMDKDNSYS